MFRVKVDWMVMVLIMAFLLSCTGLAQERPEITTICMEHVTFGKDASQEAVVTWRSSEKGAEGYVKYWPSDSKGDELQAQADFHNYRYARDQVYIYDARLADLKPNTLYNYKIIYAGEESPTYSFYSAPKPGSVTGFTFAVMGDSRSGYDVWAKLMRVADDSGARFVLFTGDMTDGASQPEWDYWFAAAADTLPNIPVMPIHGNHEYMSQTYFDQFVLPDDEKNYSFDYGMTHWATVLSIQEYMDEAREWLKEDLIASDAIWKFLSTHKPFYASSPDFNPLESPKEFLLDVVEDNGVSVVFHGHVHTYERTHPMLGGEKADGGVIYQVTGGAGAPFYPAPEEPEDYSAAYIDKNHIIIYDITPEVMKATVKSLNGNIIDEYVVYPRLK